MKFKSLITAADGHKRSSFVITLIGILTFILSLLEALPVPLQESKWVAFAIAIIGAILILLNRPKEE